VPCWGSGSPLGCVVDPTGRRANSRKFGFLEFGGGAMSRAEPASLVSGGSDQQVATGLLREVRERPDGDRLDQARPANDNDQTARASEQKGSDRAQTVGVRHEAGRDRHDEASVAARLAADRELADGAEHGLNREPRQPTSAERPIGAALCDRTAIERLEIAPAHDPARQRRDAPRTTSDLTGGDADGRDANLRPEEARARAAADRAAAAVDRKRAAEDREAAASLRAAAAHDRRQAVRERKLAGIDALTGVSLRGVGMGEIAGEIQRARRTGTPLALAFVDVNNLKAVNDNDGHFAGDTLLKQVAATLRTKLRPYDVIMRFGGDEFVCALSNMNTEDARERFVDIIGTLETNGFLAPFSYGVAELEHGDDLERLLARADADMIHRRRTSGHRG